MDSKLEPLHDIVFVKKINEERSSGGLIIPDAARNSSVGVVVAKGPGVHGPTGFVPTTVQVGDQVLLDRFENNEIDIDGEKLVVVRETAILARKPAGAAS